MRVASDELMRLTDAETAFAEYEYPITTIDLLAQVGDERLELQNGEGSVAGALARAGERTFESPAEVMDALMTGVGHEAVGRRFYSDRDPTTSGDEGPPPVSF